MDINILSQIITLVESHQPDDYELAQSILNKCLNKNTNTRVIGITGIPGVGKSTFIEQFGLFQLNKGKKVAVLAIDPSSTISGGSILGDKTRMQSLSENPNAFIRPTPSQGVLGGVAQKTYETIQICKAVDFDYVIVETVGVGQSESTMSNMVDFFLLLTLANTGDDLQGIKRGILEQAHGIVFTKYDGTNRTKTDHAFNELDHAIRFFPNLVPDWQTQIKKSSSLENEGFKEIDLMLLKYFKTINSNNYLIEKRLEQDLYWFKSSINFFLTTVYLKDPLLNNLYNDYINKINNQKITATSAAKKFIDQIMSQN